MTSVLITNEKRSNKTIETIKDPERNQFLNCSRENLNISEIDNVSYRKKLLSIKLNKQIIFNVLIIIIILLSIGIEMIILPNNSQQIELLKQDLNELKRQFYEENFLNELKSFEQQLYDDGIETESDYPSYEDEDYKSNEMNSDDDKKKKNDTAGLNHILNAIHKFKEKQNENIQKEVEKSVNRTSRSKRAVDRFGNRHYHKAEEKRDRVKQLKVPRQTVAAHFQADSSLFDHEDEYLGNGKIRHAEGIFKAWNTNDWFDDFGMDKYFSLARDGNLIVYESGLYFVYAQIHYLDEHDENGFHVLVNGNPIMQCMIYSPGTGHKSRSCYSAQVTFIENGDRVLLKDIGASRYTLFQRDKSFFGLIKIGDMKNSQQPTISTTQTSHETQDAT